MKKKREIVTFFFNLISHACYFFAYDLFGVFRDVQGKPGERWTMFFNQQRELVTFFSSRDYCCYFAHVLFGVFRDMQGQPGEQWTMFFKDPSGNNLEFKAMTTPSNLFTKYNVDELDHGTEGKEDAAVLGADTTIENDEM